VPKGVRAYFWPLGGASAFSPEGAVEGGRTGNPCSLRDHKNTVAIGSQAGMIASYGLARGRSSGDCGGDGAALRLAQIQAAASPSGRDAGGFESVRVCCRGVEPAGSVDCLPSTQGGATSDCGSHEMRRMLAQPQGLHYPSQVISCHVQS
jgi:hypothetical protein